MKKLLKARGIWHFCPVSNGMGAHGIPDFICCWNGRFLGVETKAPGRRNNTSGLQELQLRGIAEAGGAALVIDDASQLAEFLDAEHIPEAGAHDAGRQARPGLRP